MEIVYTIALVLHVVTGLSALVLGLVAIVARKGGGLHRLSGRVFYWCMLTVAVSGALMASLHWSPFLLHIAVFALFQTQAGWRAVKNKGLMPSGVDWILAVAGLVNGGLMVVSLEVVLLVFGVIQVILAVGALRIYLDLRAGRALRRKQWLRQHIGMMMGAYIGTSTAFLVVNVRDVNPAWLPWLVPTVLGVPLIGYFTRKFVGRERVAA